ncbi:porin family protein [Maribacter sp. R86514]|uniref:porin family protein n=1 Tax=Maribacter sp. R86514 TaxID=3093854 RepID=UPI0037C86AF4
MKKHYFLVLSFLIFNAAIWAQESRFGVKAGLNVSNIDDKDSFYDENSNYRTSFHAGLFVEIPLSSKFSFQPELLYSSIGKVDEYDLNYRSFDLEPLSADSFKLVQKINYLAVPLIFKWYVGQRFYINAGPQVSFLLNTVDKAKGDDLPESFSEVYRSSGDFKLDYGAVLGVGYTINDDLNIGLQYYRGLKNLFGDSDFGIIDRKAYHSVFQLSASYSVF